MTGLLRRLFGRQESAPTADGERTLALEREAQQLRLELQERERQRAQLRAELERQREGVATRLNEGVQASLERLFADASSPVAQLLTQAHLLEAGKPVQARDVLSVARRLVRVLEDRGLQLVGAAGETTAFDPNRHAPLSAEVSLAAAERVIVRLVGVAHQGKVLHKAGVEKAGG